MSRSLAPAALVSTSAALAMRWEEESDALRAPLQSGVERPLDSIPAYLRAVRGAVLARGGSLDDAGRIIGPSGTAEDMRLVAQGWRACIILPSAWGAWAAGVEVERGRDPQALLDYWGAVAPRPDRGYESPYNPPLWGVARACALGIPAEDFPRGLSHLLPEGRGWRGGRDRILAVLALARAGWRDLPAGIVTADLRRLARAPRIWAVRAAWAAQVDRAAYLDALPARDGLASLPMLSCGRRVDWAAARDWQAELSAQRQSEGVAAAALREPARDMRAVDAGSAAAVLVSLAGEACALEQAVAAWARGMWSGVLHRRRARVCMPPIWRDATGAALPLAEAQVEEVRDIRDLRDGARVAVCGQTLGVISGRGGVADAAVTEWLRGVEGRAAQGEVWARDGAPSPQVETLTLAYDAQHRGQETAARRAIASPEWIAGRSAEAIRDLINGGAALADAVSACGDRRLQDLAREGDAAAAAQVMRMWLRREGASCGGVYSPAAKE